VFPSGFFIVTDRRFACRFITIGYWMIFDIEHHFYVQQVAFWAFPQDIHLVHAYTKVTDSAWSWHWAVEVVTQNRVTNMWQVGK